MTDRTIVTTKTFVKNYKDLKHGGKRNMKLLDNLLRIIKTRGVIPSNHVDHQLRQYRGNVRQLHVQGDWLLLYELSPDDNTVTFRETGSHSSMGYFS